MAARKIEDAEAFAAKHNIDTAYGDYQALAQDPNVDVSNLSNIDISMSWTIFISRLFTLELSTQLI